MSYTRVSGGYPWESEANACRKMMLFEFPIHGVARFYSE